MECGSCGVATTRLDSSYLPDGRLVCQSCADAAAIADGQAAATVAGKRVKTVKVVFYVVAAASLVGLVAFFVVAGLPPAPVGAPAVGMAVWLLSIGFCFKFDGCKSRFAGGCARKT